MQALRENELVGQIYEAALSPHLWNDVLEQMRLALGTAAAVTIISNDTAAITKSERLHALAGAHPSDFASFGEHYCTVDARWPYVQRMPERKVYRDFPEIPVPDYYKTEIFCDFLRPRGVDRPMGAVIARHSGKIATFSTYLPIGRDFTGAQTGLLSRLTPHLSRALHVESKMAAAQAQGAKLALDHVSAAAFIVNHAGQARDMNQQAQALLRTRSEALRITSSGHLALLTPGAQDNLLRALSQAYRVQDGELPPLVFRLAAAMGDLSVLVTAARFSSLSAWRPAPQALVLIADRSHPQAIEPALLASEFGLTRAEARVVSDLAAGDNVEGIAAVRGLARDTVYLHVKHALGKTGAGSQAQLVGMALRGVSAFARRPT